MCGIAGIVNLNGVMPGDLHEMSVVLKHRGPDDEGFTLFDNSSRQFHFKGNDTISELQILNHISSEKNKPDVNVGFVHRRLSILDLSPAGHQPMSYDENNSTLIFNGEIYNYKEIKKELIKKGFQFKSDTDTEVILAAYKEWGVGCVQRFVGMWAFALYDYNQKNIFLSRDRFGIKPLYFSHTKGKFAFASEIKALLKLDFVKPEADMTAIYEYISFGATSNPSANLFKNINVMPPAHNMFLDIRDLNFKIEKYYSLEEKVNSYHLPSENNMIKTFSGLLNDSIDLHLRSDVPVGSTLSGGLDSSTLVAIAAAKMQGKTFKTFTAAYHEPEIDESDFAKKVVSSHSNIEAKFIYPEIKTYWEDLEKLIWFQDLPINSTSTFAHWEVMKLANQNKIKVLLDGQGADEILGGYYNFAGIHLIELFKQLRFKQFLLERKSLQTNFAPNIDVAFGRAAYYFLPMFMQRSIRAKKRLGMNFIADSHKNELSGINVPPRGGKTYKEHSLMSTEFGLQDLLRYEDRNSMAFSIESRVPFLDHRLVEFSIALKNEWKIKNGWTKYILRKAAEPLLDKKVVWRKYKMGFLTPQKLWKEKSQIELNSFVNETQVPDFLDKNYLLKLNSAVLTDASHLSEFWKIISFLKWIRVFNVTFQ